MKKTVLLFTLLLSLFATAYAKNEPLEPVQEIDNSIIIARISNEDIQVSIPSPIFSFTDAEIKIKFLNPEHTKLLLNRNRVEFIINGESKVLEFVNGEASFKHRFDTSRNISIYAEDFSYNHTVTVYPLWAILIPVIVIGLYLLKRMLTKKQA
jgi:hypothetical protein